MYNVVQAVYSDIPSPANFHIWGWRKSDLCPLCCGRESLDHLLSNKDCAVVGPMIRHSRQWLMAAIKNINECHHPKTCNYWRETKLKQRMAFHHCINSEEDSRKQLKFPAQTKPSWLLPDMITISEIDGAGINRALERAHRWGKNKKVCQVPGPMTV